MPVNNLNEDASIIQPMKRPFLQQPVMNQKKLYFKLKP